MEFEYLWSMPNKWTFEMKPVKEFLLNLLKNHKRILIPFAGMTRFEPINKQIIYIDIDSTKPQPCLYGDCIEMMQILINTNQKYDLIISDPPFTFFQMIHTYNNKKMQDITRCKELYDQLLTKDGKILHFGFNSTGMGMNRGYIKEKIWLINSGGSHNDLIILLEKRGVVI